MRCSFSRSTAAVLLAGVLALTLGACSSNQPPIVRPAPPPPPPGGEVQPEPELAGRVPRDEPLEVPPEPVALRDDAVASKSLDDLNREAVLRPAFFAYDSSELSSDARQVLDANAALLRQSSTWSVTIEGHADERGSAEYNLALGDRRAAAARAYLLSLGIANARLRTVTYGKEFPFDPGHTEEAWAANRRVHFVITAR